MAIESIDPKAVRTQSNDKKKALGGLGFSDVLDASNPLASTLVTQSTQNYQPGAMTSAAMSGVSNASGNFNPGGSSGGASIAGLGIASAGNAPYLGVADYTPPPFSNVPPGGNGSLPPPGSIPGGTNLSGAPSQDYQEKEALFQQMNDANWQMLVAQVKVNEISRHWTAVSNTVAKRDESLANMLRNFK